jgi:dipeptidyl aminopeptidase/acylaminoacyl peptidase
MNHRPLPLVTCLFLLLLAAGGAAAEDRPSPRSAVDRLFDELAAVRSFKQAAVSPDGKKVAWVEVLRHKDDEPEAPSTIYVADLGSPDARPRRLAGGHGQPAFTDHSVAWSPDGRQFAFLSDRDKKDQLQVYLADARNLGTRKLTDVKGFLATPRWSPDGKQLAVLFTEDAARKAGPTQAGTPETGVIEERVYEQRLALIDPESGHVRQVSPPDLYVYEYDWSPDSKSLAVIAAHGSGDNNWYLAQLYTLAVDSGALRSLWKPDMQIAVPRWSPDGRSVAVIGGLMSDEGANGGEIYLVPAEGGKPRDLTPGLKASAAWLTWQPGGKRLLFTEQIDGKSGIAALDADTGHIETVWTGAEVISAGEGMDVSLSRDHQMSAVVRSSFGQPPEVWAGPLGDWKQVSHVNRDARPQWGEARSLHWKSDPFTVQGWLLYPRDFDPKQHYPLIVSVHGGPASQLRPAWPGAGFSLAALASQGYFVFFPNPRGSFGQGEAFTRANVKDLGHGDLRDILAGVDEVLKVAPVDPDRMGIAGWSYGGYMTMWAVTQTHRFKAAVAGAGIANWQSYYGENGIDQWLIPYFGASVYDDPAVYARSSPITFIKTVRTPTLVLVGERDLECPAPQSREFWHALRTLDVPTQLVIYPDEGHGVRRPSHRRDILRRTAAWLDRYLRPSTAAPD